MLHHVETMAQISRYWVWNVANLVLMLILILVALGLRVALSLTIVGFLPVALLLPVSLLLTIPGLLAVRRLIIPLVPSTVALVVVTARMSAVSLLAGAIV